MATNKELQRLKERYGRKHDELSLDLSVALKTGGRASDETKKYVAIALAGYMRKLLGLNDDDTLFLVKKLNIMTKRLSAESLERILLMFYDRIRP